MNAIFIYFLHHAFHLYWKDMAFWQNILVGHGILVHFLHNQFENRFS